jgi:Uma2 family endonuclease
MIATVDTVLDRPWTTETFLASEYRQEGKHEFDGRDVIPKTGGNVAHQRIVGNLWAALIGLLDDGTQMAMLEMRLPIGTRIRYPDVVVCVGRSTRPPAP